MDGWEPVAEEVVALLRAWHPAWVVEAKSLEHSSAVMFVLNCPGLTYRYSVDMRAILEGKPEALAWFMSRVVSGAMQR
jgi:hypothetical protein